MRELIKLITVIRKHKEKVVIFTIFIILILGSIGFCQTLKKKDILISIFKSVTLLGLDTPKPVNIYNGLGFVMAVFLVYAGFFLLVFHNLLNNVLFKLFLKDKNIVLFGFGEINKNFLENFRKDRKNDNIIVVDKEDKNFDEFWEKGYIFLKKEIDDELIKKFDFEKTTDIIVALGNDRVNIDVALKLIDKLKEVKTATKLIVHISDRDISDLFFEKLEKVKKEQSNIKIDLKTFSFETEVVNDLFEKYATKLVPYDYVKLNNEKNELKVAIVGNSCINIELIKRIFVNFIFPNNLQTKIFLIDKNEKEFYKKVEFETNYSKEKFPHIELEAKHLNYDLLKDKSFWFDKDLIDVFIAFENENKNLETAIDLFEKVFVYENKNNLEYPNIFFAMYEELAFSDYIDNNKENFKNFFTFGSMKDILNVKNLLDDEKFEGAKQIHYGYGTKFNKDKIIEDKNKLNEKWFHFAKYSDKLSNIAQYEHIPYKLLSLGFYKEKSDKNIKELLKENQKILFSKLKQFNMPSEEEIFRFSCEVESSYNDKVNYKFNKKTVDNFWNKFINSGDFYNLVNTEHKRWMAYHYLNGWEYADKKDKLRKRHNCLVELKDFEDYERKLTLIYDIYSYLYLPNYLVAGRYKIKS
jgi:hypothetical protein